MKRSPVGLIAFIVVLMLFISQCGRSERRQESVADNAALDTGTINATAPDGDGATAAATSEGQSLPVPSDPRASYRLLEWRGMPNGHREAITRRDGPSGTSFARREIDCDAMLFRYLGEGDSLEDARRDSPNIGPMSELIPGSISTEVSTFVCGR